MRQTVKYFSIIIVVFLLLNIYACSTNDANGQDESFSINADDFDMTVPENSNGDNNPDDGESSGTANENNGSKDNKSALSQNDAKKANLDSSNSPGSTYYFDDEEFKPMEIPSRKNAYKLFNTYNKMKNGEAVKVVYFGGSVTRGHGASNEDKYSWRALTTAYLKSLSSGTVEEINVAEGGTGSYFGASRFEYDVSSKNPDLVFIEFLVNDGYSGLSAEQSQANLEYMINTLYAKNPYTDVVLVLVTNTTIYGRQTSLYNAQVGIANYYNIPIVDFGGELYNKFEGSLGLFNENFNDSVHPNDKGYKLYADIMADALKELLVSAPVAAHKKPAKALAKNGFSTLANIQASTFKDSKWDVNPWLNSKNNNYHALYPKCLGPKNTNATLKVNFTGNTFGFIGTVKTDCTLTFVVDGSGKKIIQGSSANKIEYPLFDNLANTEHTVTVTVAGNTDAEIAAFVTTK